MIVKYICHCDLCSLPYEEKIKKLKDYEISAVVYLCLRCGMRFYPKNHDKIPLRCPNKDCGSPYWQRKKKQIKY